MRTLLAIIALFSLTALHAQHPDATFGIEQPRSALRAYPTLVAASAASGENDTYFTRLDAWSREGSRFTTPFTVPFAWANRQVLLHVGAASAGYRISINGQEVAHNNDGNTPAEVNLTRYVKEGRNTLEIRLADPAATAPLESWKQAPAPTLDATWIMSQPTLRIRDVVYKTWDGDDGAVNAEVGVIGKSSALNPRTSRIYYDLLTPSGEVAATGFKDMTLDMRREDTLRFLTRIPAHLLWNPELPTQYTLRLRTQHEGRYLEFMELKMGFRSLTAHNGELSINTRPLTPHVKEVSPTISDNEIALLREQGTNILFLHPGAIREGLLEFCDEQGMYVIVQAPIDSRSSGTSRRRGGNPSNDPAWREEYRLRTEGSYHTTKRHPSVIAFSQAVKSANGINLYESYLNMKRFDEVRPMIYLDAAGEWNTDALKF